MDWLMPNPGSRLLALPSELRDLIFEYALTSANTVVTFRLDPYQEDSYSQAVQPALTRVNRQVRRESLPVWYWHSNAFIMHTEATKADHTMRWLKCNERYLPLLREVEVWVRVLGSSNNLRSVASGAVGLVVARKGGDATWRVQEGWRWITVCRKPAGVEEDVLFLKEKLGEARDVKTAWDWAELLATLKKEYTKRKAG
nr:hypothetical protein CFP56_62763 [Quercus suber]